MIESTEVIVKPLRHNVAFHDLCEGTFFEYAQGNDPVKAMKLSNGKWATLGGTIIDNWEVGTPRIISRVFEKVTLE